MKKKQLVGDEKGLLVQLQLKETFKVCGCMPQAFAC